MSNTIHTKINNSCHENSICFQNHPSLAEIKDNIRYVMQRMKTSDRPEFNSLGPSFTDYKRFISGLSIQGYKFKKPFQKSVYDEFVDKKITEIKKEVEKNFWEKHADELMDMLLDEEGMKEYVEAKKKKMLKREKILRDEEEWNAQVEKLQTDFMKVLKDEMEDIDKRLESDKVFNYLKGKVELENLMMKKLDETIHATIKDITNNFSSILEKENELFYEHFQFFYKFEQTRIEGVRTVESLVSETLLDTLKKTEENSKFNAMYAFGQNSCSCHSLQHFVNKLEELKVVLKKTGMKLAETSKNVRTVDSTENIENRLYTIIKHFQKFKAFVVSAVPHFSDYFENIEKLMFFELTQIVIKRRPELFVNDRLVIERSEPCICKKSGVPLVIELQESHDRRVHGKDSSSMYSTPYSSGLMFDKNLCVREDFRSMIRKGLEKTDSNELYIFHFGGKHKEKDICAKSESCSEVALNVYDLEGNVSTVNPKIGEFEPSNNTFIKKPSSMTNHSVRSWEVQEFKFDGDDSDTTTIKLIPTKSKLLDVKDSILLQKTKSISHQRRATYPSFSIVGEPLYQKSSIRLATDSLALLRKYKSKDTLRKSRASRLTPTFPSNIGPNTNPRLSLARNSVEMLRRTKSRISEDSINKPKDFTRMSEVVDKTYKDLFDSISLCSDTSTKELISFLSKLRALRRQSSAHKNFDKTVGISHFEIISLTALQSAINLVNFESKQTVILLDNYSSYAMGECDMDIDSETDNFLKKLNQLKIIGDPNTTEHKMDTREFLLTRMNKYSKMIKKYPFLRKYFQPKDNKTYQNNCEEKILQ